MGKGDKKTKRGKIISGTYGVRRLKKRKGTTAKISDRSEIAGKKAKKPIEPGKKKPQKKKETEEKSPDITEKAKIAAPSAKEKKVMSA
ncbi:MAG: 30S ribosomal protein THX, partial [Bacteroidales bacterium]